MMGGEEALVKALVDSGWVLASQAGRVVEEEEKEKVAVWGRPRVI